MILFIKRLHCNRFYYIRKTRKCQSGAKRMRTKHEKAVCFGRLLFEFLSDNDLALLGSNRLAGSKCIAAGRMENDNRATVFEFYRL